MSLVVWVGLKLDGTTHKLGRRKYGGGEAVGARGTWGLVGRTFYRVAHWRPR
jgi:hypothetical protein